MYTITVEDKFSAAHRLRDYPGSCSRLHGHNYKVIVSVTTEDLDKIGLAFDFRELKKITHDAMEMLDHQNLNKLEPFLAVNPSAENIARVVYSEISKHLPDRVTLKEIKIVESEGCTITYTEGSSSR